MSASTTPTELTAVRINKEDTVDFFKERFPVGTNLYAESMVTTLLMVVDGDKRGQDFHLRSVAGGRAFYMHPGEREAKYVIATNGTDSMTLSADATGLLAGGLWYTNTMQYAPLSEKQSRHLSNGLDVLIDYMRATLSADEHLAVLQMINRSGEEDV